MLPSGFVAEVGITEPDGPVSRQISAAGFLLPPSSRTRRKYGNRKSRRAARWIRTSRRGDLPASKWARGAAEKSVLKKQKTGGQTWPIRRTTSGCLCDQRSTWKGKCAEVRSLLRQPSRSVMRGPTVWPLRRVGPSLVPLTSLPRLREYDPIYRAAQVANAVRF